MGFLRKNRRVFIGIGVLLALAAGLSNGKQAAIVYAAQPLQGKPWFVYANRTCGPADGPAWDVRWQQKLEDSKRDGIRYPQLTLSVWTDTPVLNQPIHIGLYQSNGALSWCPAAGKCVQLEGAVTFTHVGPTEIAGELLILSARYIPVPQAAKPPLRFKVRPTAPPYRAMCG